MLIEVTLAVFLKALVLTITQQRGIVTAQMSDFASLEFSTTASVEPTLPVNTSLQPTPSSSSIIYTTTPSRSVDYVSSTTKITSMAMIPSSFVVNSQPTLQFATTVLLVAPSTLPLSSSSSLLSSMSSSLSSLLLLTSSPDANTIATLTADQLIPLLPSQTPDITSTSTSALPIPPFTSSVVASSPTLAPSPLPSSSPYSQDLATSSQEVLSLSSPTTTVQLLSTSSVASQSPSATLLLSLPSSTLHLTSSLSPAISTSISQVVSTLDVVITATPTAPTSAALVDPTSTSLPDLRQPSSDTFNPLTPVVVAGVMGILILVCTSLLQLVLCYYSSNKGLDFIHLNIVVALVCGLLLLSVGTARDIRSKSDPELVACKVFSGLTTYFLLVPLSWLGAESIYLNYLYEGVARFHVAMAALLFGLCWMFPVVIVLITGVAARQTSIARVGDNVACWLSAEDSVYMAFFTPVIAIAIVVAILVTLLLLRIFRWDKKKEETSNETEEKKTLSPVWFGLISMAMSGPLMVLSWIFLLAYFNNPDNAGLGWLFWIVLMATCVVIFLVYVVYPGYPLLKKKFSKQKRTLQLGGTAGDSSGTAMSGNTFTYRPGRASGMPDAGQTEMERKGSNGSPKKDDSKEQVKKNEEESGEAREEEQVKKNEEESSEAREEQVKKKEEENGEAREEEQVGKNEEESGEAREEQVKKNEEESSEAREEEKVENGGESNGDKEKFEETAQV